MLIRAVDLETTGLEPPPTDAACQIGWCDLVDGVVGAMAGTFIDPGRPIPPQASAVHHIIDADVAGAPAWREAVNDMLGGDQITAFAAHNSRFEDKHLTPEVVGSIPWLCTYRCALRVWPDAPDHKNQTLRYWLNPEGLDRAIANVAHRAPEDAYVTAFIARELLKHQSLDMLLKWSSRPAVLLTVGFGKHAGMKWSDVDTGYLRWITGQDFDEDVLYTAKYWLHQHSLPKEGAG